MEVVTSRTIVHPLDLERSLAFYGEVLDLPVVREFGAGEGRGVVFAVGGGQIEVVPADADAPANGRRDHRDLAPPGSAPWLALWLQVRSATAAVAEVRGRGATVLREPTLEPWGLVEALIEDPDGLRIHLVEVPAEHPLRRDPRRSPGGAVVGGDQRAGGPSGRDPG